MSRYKLAPHTHVCVTEQGSVFLDLRLDTYIGIDVEQSAALSNLVEGWPTAPNRPDLAQDAQSFAETLCDRHLLTRATDGHSAAPPRVAPLTDELIAWERMRNEPPRVHQVLTFFRALLVALFMLRSRSLLATVRRCERRHARRTGRDFPLEKARDLLSAYTLIRLFVFSRRGRCLLDSIALMEFMAAYGIHPRWVLGVQVRPFAAHSWVQEQSWVLNGTVGFVRTYRPILVV